MLLDDRPGGHGDDTEKDAQAIRELQDGRLTPSSPVTSTASRRVCHPDLMYTHSNGVTDTLASYLEKCRNGFYVYHAVDHPVTKTPRRRRHGAGTRRDERRPDRRRDTQAAAQQLAGGLGARRRHVAVDRLSAHREGLTCTTCSTTEPAQQSRPPQKDPFIPCHSTSSPEPGPLRVRPTPARTTTGARTTSAPRRGDRRALGIHRRRHRLPRPARRRRSSTATPASGRCSPTTASSTSRSRCSSTGSSPTAAAPSPTTAGDDVPGGRAHRSPPRQGRR